MPGGDGTGPLGKGPIVGRNIRGQGRTGNAGVGPNGYCICPNCGEKIVHTAGVPCTAVKCPKCGASMIREL